MIPMPSSHRIVQHEPDERAHFRWLFWLFVLAAAVTAIGGVSVLNQLLHPAITHGVGRNGLLIVGPCLDLAACLYLVIGAVKADAVGDYLYAVKTHQSPNARRGGRHDVEVQI